MDKLIFLKTEFPRLLATLNPESKGNWGVLNAQQMVEHMADSVSIATGKNNQKLHTPAEQVSAYKAFAMSEKEFKPNTKNALMAEVPVPTIKPSMAEAIKLYEDTLADFVAYFEQNKEATLTNPFFGDLNYQEWIHLLHKHAVHHCKQFGLLH
jgi:oxepin-CoA hydrolase/3-oxo-5,6-dehydrosuberyl-CoA semialdehyde dehydrogenase